MRTFLKKIDQIITDEEMIDASLSKAKSPEEKRRILDERDKDLSHCPLPIDVIPNNMGINLVAVDSIGWQRQADGQLTQVTIYFNPEQK